MAAVSDEMRRRIGRALDAGERPTLRGNNLRLGTVVLQRADGRDTPALAVTEETMRQRGIDTAGAFDSFAAAAPDAGAGLPMLPTPWVGSTDSRGLLTAKTARHEQGVASIAPKAIRAGSCMSRHICTGEALGSAFGRVATT